MFRLLYADDIQTYVQTPAHLIEQGIAKLSDSAKIVALWAEINSLALNTKKTQAIVFGSSHTLKIFKNLNIPSISIYSIGDNVSFVNTVSNLGVILDSTLSCAPKIH